MVFRHCNPGSTGYLWTAGENFQDRAHEGDTQIWPGHLPEGAHQIWGRIWQLELTGQNTTRELWGEKALGLGSS